MHRSELSGPSDEDELRIPPSWHKILHPRRGGLPGPALQPEPLTFREYGDSSPVEAAQRALRAMPGGNARLFRFVDTWVRDRGIGFAASATVELARDKSTRETKARQDALLRMRGYLAAADEEDYAEAVGALAEARRDFAGRLYTSYLAPTETLWTDEVCAGYHAPSRSTYERCLLACILSTPQQLAMVGDPRQIIYATGLAELVTLLDGLGTGIMTAFADLLNGGGYASADSSRAAYSVIAVLPGDETFEALARRLDRKYVSGAVIEAMERFPVRALRLLAKTANSRSAGTAAAAAALRLLAAHVRTHPELVEATLTDNRIPERDAKLIARLAHHSTERPEAAADELPPLLVSPPWTRRRAKGAKGATATVVAGLEPPQAGRVDWAPGEREAWAAKNPYPHAQIDWRRLARDYATNGFGHGNVWNERTFFLEAPEDLARPLLPGWLPSLNYGNTFDRYGPIVARFDQDAIALAVGTALGNSPGNSGRLLQPLVDPRVARIMADWLTRLKAGRPPAVSWLTRHAAAAALLLVPDAVGEPGERRVAAETALRFLAPLTDVPAAARHYGPQAEAAVAEILAFDPLDLHPQRMPAPPHWLEQVRLPQILLRGRELALPAESVRHVVSMLAISKPAAPYAGIAVLRECADPRSSADFAWALFEAWLAVGMPAKDGWAFTALGTLGDDDTARRITPFIRAWPGEGGHQRAVAGLDVLAEIGTDTALMQLDQISRKVKFKALKSRAQEKVAEIAGRLELTADQLGDRLVPDFGLDAEGTMWLDYGPRRFRVGFDEQLRPFVTDESGVHRKNLPPSGSKDDPELAAAARTHFSGLKKDVRTVAGDVIRRLESGMVAGRTWRAGEFRELLLGHPLVWHITGRLVWLAGTADGESAAGAGAVDAAGAVLDPAAETAFRVAEDRTLATVDDVKYELPDDALVRLAHPLRLGGELAAWTELFADYEILQPFAQLGRPVHALTEQERGASRLTRFEGLSVPLGRVLGLVHRGWRRGTPMDAGVENNIARKVSEDLHLIIDLNPGITTGYVTEYGEHQTLQEVYLARHHDDYWNRGRANGPRLGELDPITASELLGDLTQLTN